MQAMIKKILSIIFVSLLVSGNAFATMNEVKKIRLLVEYLNDRPCNVTRESVEITTKYILSNSKLKITEDYDDPYLYIQPIIMESEGICTAALNVSLKQSYMLKDGSYNEGDFVYYFNNTLIFTSSKNSFKGYFVESLEEEIKKFVVEWSEYNK